MRHGAITNGPTNRESDDGRAEHPNKSRAASQRARREAGCSGGPCRLRPIPYITRKIPYYEVLGEEGLVLWSSNADTILEEIGIDFRDDPEAIEIWKAAGADVQGERVHFARGMCRSLIQRSAPRGVHPACPQSGAQRADRRQEHGIRAGLWVAVRAQSRRRPPLRANRGFPEFRQARLHGQFPAPFGRHDLRTRGSAGQQAAPRHGVQPSEIQRQGLHGFGDGTRAGRGFGRDGEHRVRRGID